ncbi:MAG: hypothetical protein EGR81_06850 [Ruminococcaceae bacterium]|nr:hypothetical protein [Oscillospiraceae bacterium]MBD8961953.1 hypothetical protein [Oscillospiraceae bacterium]
MFSSDLGSMPISRLGGLTEIAFKTEIFLPPDYGSNTQKQQRKGQNRFNRIFKNKYKKPSKKLVIARKKLKKSVNLRLQRIF